MTQRHYLVVDGSKYYLLPGTDVDALAARLLAAAKRGGEIVDLDVVGMTHLKVLVTPGAPVLIESDTIPVGLPLDASESDEPESDGVDYYDEYRTRA